MSNDIARTFYQASWIGRGGVRVYGDVETAGDRARMQAPLDAAGFELHKAEAENMRDLKRRRNTPGLGVAVALHEPTPRAQRPLPALDASLAEIGRNSTRVW